MEENKFEVTEQEFLVDEKGNQILNKVRTKKIEPQQNKMKTADLIDSIVKVVGLLSLIAAFGGLYLEFKKYNDVKYQTEIKAYQDSLESEKKDKNYAIEQLHEYQQDSLKNFNDLFNRQLNLLKSQLDEANNQRNYSLEKAKFDTAILQNLNSIIEARNREINHEYYTNQMSYFFKAIQSVSSILDLPFNSKEYNEERHNLFIANGTLMLLNDSSVIRQFEEFQNHIRFYEMFNKVILKCDSIFSVNSDVYSKMHITGALNQIVITDNRLINLVGDLIFLSEHMAKMSRDSLAFPNNPSKTIFTSTISGTVEIFIISEFVFANRVYNNHNGLYDFSAKNYANEKRNKMYREIEATVNTDYDTVKRLKEQYEILIKGMDNEKEYLNVSSKKLASAMASSNIYTNKHN